MLPRLVRVERKPLRLNENIHFGHKVRRLLKHLEGLGREGAQGQLGYCCQRSKGLKDGAFEFPLCEPRDCMKKETEVL